MIKSVLPMQQLTKTSRQRQCTIRFQYISSQDKRFKTPTVQINLFKSFAFCFLHSMRSTHHIFDLCDVQMKGNRRNAFSFFLFFINLQESCLQYLWLGCMEARGIVGVLKQIVTSLRPI